MTAVFWLGSATRDGSSYSQGQPESLDSVRGVFLHQFGNRSRNVRSRVIRSRELCKPKPRRVARWDWSRHVGVGAGPAQPLTGGRLFWPIPRRISLLVSEHVHFCARRSPSAAELVRREVRSGVFEVTCARSSCLISKRHLTPSRTCTQSSTSRGRSSACLCLGMYGRRPAELHCWALATGSSYRAGQQPRVRTVPWCMCEGCSLQRLADTDWVENGQAMFRREIQSQHWGQLDPQSACDDA